MQTAVRFVYTYIWQHTSNLIANSTSMNVIILYSIDGRAVVVMNCAHIQWYSLPSTCQLSDETLSHALACFFVLFLFGWVEFQSDSKNSFIIIICLKIERSLLAVASWLDNYLHCDCDCKSLRFIFPFNTRSRIDLRRKEERNIVLIVWNGKWFIQYCKSELTIRLPKWTKLADKVRRTVARGKPRTDHK